MVLETNCEWCGKSFKFERSTAKYCSAACRKAASRYSPQQTIDYNKENMISNFRAMLRVLDRSPHLIVEVDEALREVQQVLSGHTREWYKQVLNEENKRLESES